MPGTAIHVGEVLLSAYVSRDTHGTQEPVSNTFLVTGILISRSSFSAHYVEALALC